MSNITKVNFYSSSTNKLINIGSNYYFVDDNTDVRQYYLYQYFPYVEISGRFTDNINSNFYCVDVRRGSTYLNDHIDNWNITYTQFPFTFNDNTLSGTFRPVFIEPGTRPIFEQLFSSIMSGTTNTKVKEVIIRKTVSNITIKYNTYDNDTYVTTTYTASSFHDNTLPKRMIVELQGSGGGGGNGGRADLMRNGNGGGSGGYVICVLDIDNVYEWQITLGEPGVHGENQGTGGTPSYIKYKPTSISNYINAIQVNAGGGGSGGMSSPSSYRGDGGTVEFLNVTHCWELLSKSGVNGGNAFTGNTGEAEGTTQFSKTCGKTNVIRPNTYITRGGMSGGRTWNDSGNGGGASYFENGGDGVSSTPGDIYYPTKGAGGGGGAYNFFGGASGSDGGSAVIYLYA